MQHLQIFQQSKEMAAVSDMGARIVSTLSENYAEIIRGMVGKSENTKRKIGRASCRERVSVVV